jgi:hypothetical protein
MILSQKNKSLFKINTTLYKIYLPSNVINLGTKWTPTKSWCFQGSILCTGVFKNTSPISGLWIRIDLNPDPDTDPDPAF